MKKTLIKNIRIVNPFGEPEFIENGRVSIMNDKIEKVGSGILEENDFDEILDFSGKTVLPGMINMHHHLYSSLAIGMPPPQKIPNNFTEILEQIWWKLDLALDENSTRASFETGLLECLKCGVTTVIDHHSSPNFTEGSLEMLAEIAEKFGINISPAFEITDRNGEGYFESGLAVNLRTLQKHENNPHVFPLLGLHASFTLSDKSLEKIAESDCGIHIHVSEDKADEEYTKRLGYPSVIQRLNHFGLLNERSLVAHGIHILPEDLEILQKTGANLVHNPTSNANNKVGILSSEIIEKTKVGLGTDGMQASMLSEAKEGVLIRSSHKEKNVDYFAFLFENNSQIVSKLSGLKLGNIQPGYQADLVFFDYSPKTEITKENFSAHILFGLENPTDVITRGKFRIRNGKCVDLNEFEILEKARLQAKLIWNKMN
ncbi:MAG: amidohydrolase family protein [Candidatus Marinimicrobia bacterium]|nr:amidohydrolase family protein [Candidatus Neomarinimicrobiota bacterium]